jgi:hypothetical protein
VACNLWKSGNLAEYGNRLLNENGKDWMDKLYSDAHQSLNKFSREELNELIKKYS